ncbi:MAG: ABC transporter substrate-binding protein [Waterburya sp.]
MDLLNSLRRFVTNCLAVVLAVLLLIPLTGCNPSTLLANPDQPPQIVISILSDPKTFNPVLASDKTSADVGRMLFNGLVRENPVTGEIEPALAESWSISDDQLEIIYTLRPNLKWSDGHPLTVDDVLFTYNQLYLNPDIPAGTRDILKIGQNGALPKVDQVNDRQVKFTIPEPFAPFLGATSAAILPAHVLRQTVEQKSKDGKLQFLSTWTADTPPEKIVASSAYKLASYNTFQRLVFEANPYYWKKDLERKDLPQIKKVIWEVVESTDNALLQFRSGSLDALGVSAQNFSLLKKEEQKANFTIYNGGPAYGTTFITFNLNQGQKNGKPVVKPIKSRWFNEVNFRQAVSYALNRERMIKNIFRGLGEPQVSDISKQSPYYYDGLPGYPYNPEKAKELLLAAGFTYNQQDQLLDQDGNRVSFTLNTNTGSPAAEAIGNQIEEDLGKIGIKVNFKTINFNVLIGKTDNTLDWECILLGFTGSNEPNSGFNLWSPDGSSHMFNQPVDGLSGRVIADWEAEIGRLYIEGARELDIEKRKAIYAQVQQLSSEKLPLIYLINPYSLTAVRNKIEGVEYSALGGAFWNLDQLKITE